MVELWTSQVALVLKNLHANAEVKRDTGSIPGWERCPGGGDGNPLKNPCLVNPMDRGTWWVIAPGITNIRHGWTTEHLHIQNCGRVNVAKVLYFYLWIFFLLLIQCWITKNKIYKWKDKSFYIYYNSCLWNVNYLAKFNWINNHACLVLWEPQFIVKIQNVF